MSVTLEAVLKKTSGKPAVEWKADSSRVTDKSMGNRVTWETNSTGDNDEKWGKVHI